MSTLIIIPARLKSTRLSHKLIRKLHGVEIILWVARAVAKTGYNYVVAIDDQSFVPLLEASNIPYLSTSSNHLSGTSRTTEVRNLMPGYQHY